MKLLRIRNEIELDPWHRRRADKHGYLYTLHRTSGTAEVVNWYEAKALATGVTVTLYPPYVEIQDAEKGLQS